MKLIYLILVLVVLYTVFIYFRIQYKVAHANLVKIEQTDRTFGHGPKLKYIAAGDSTAVGVGASAVEKTYTYRVASYLATGHSVDYKNIGVAGSQTQDVLDKQLAQIVDYQPVVITISIGANDLNHLTSSKKILANYKQIISTLTEKTNAKIYITDIPGLINAQLLPSWYRYLLDKKAVKLNQQLLKLETGRVKFVNIHDFGWSNYQDIQVTFAADQFHPNDEGYNNWTNAFLDRIKQDFN
jgi:acyl-CoA thioesterase-1